MQILQSEDVTPFEHKGRGIVADNLEKIYRKRKVVNGVSFHIKQGEIVGLLGPNGAGKTTTFYMIVGLIKPNGGSVFLNGENIAQRPMYKRALMGIGYLPQEMSIFRKLTVEDNIRAVLDIQGKDKAEIEGTVSKLINELGLEKIRKQMAFTLSGGEKRRTEVARILAINPDFLLLDEPFTGIDPIAIADIQRLILDLKDKMGLGILITDHNVRETLKITDRAYIISVGKILVSGTSNELISNEEARRIYLGRDFSM
jgi:lipopolysaccharide export system ATP-binding protein